jgi:hypothetical protein
VAVEGVDMMIEENQPFVRAADRRKEEVLKERGESFGVTGGQLSPSTNTGAPRHARLESRGFLVTMLESQGERTLTGKQRG